MRTMIRDAETQVGTAGGTLLSVLGNLSSGDLLRTAVLAAVGALVSFGISLLLDAVVKWIKHRL